MTRFRLSLVVALSFWSAVAGATTLSPAQQTAVMSVWQLLDYMAVDYAGAVTPAGQVARASEYAEMLEFSGQVRARIEKLPAAPEQVQLLNAAENLHKLVEQKSAPAELARSARALADRLLSAYPVPRAPKTPPQVARAATLFAENCSSCHGVQGRGDGPAAASLNPAPANFHDTARQHQRSPMSLYQTITGGLEGSAMPAFAQLDETQRWALAYYVGQLMYDDAARKRGEALWKNSAEAKSAISSPEALAQATVETLTPALGASSADDLLAYLRAHPEALQLGSGDSIELARTLLAKSLKIYDPLAPAPALELALRAYLDGFEPLEPSLKARDADQMAAAETAMINYRAGVQRGAPVAEVTALAQSADQSLIASGQLLNQGEASDSSAFAGSFIILFREGLEAILVLVAMVTFLKRSEQPGAMKYLHAGWILALVLGAFTWLAATTLISISGAQRELTEGLTGLFAVAVLVFVGLWMHSQSLAGRWQAYIQAKIKAQLSKQSLWGLAILSFVAVYREIFETVLFYSAMWEQGAHHAIITGIGMASLGLFAVGYFLFRTSRRLPIREYFLYSSLFVGFIAIVIAGKAAKSLQEAGWLQVTQVPVPKFDWLGLFPTSQTLAIQAAVLTVVVIGFWLNNRKPALLERRTKP